MKKIYKVGIALTVAIALICSSAALWNYNESANRLVRLTTYDYITDKIPDAFDGYKIAVISDLHNADFADQIVPMLRENNADIVIFTGDMVQLPDDDLTNTFAIADQISGEAEVFAVSGNHEAQNDFFYDITCQLYDHGITVLDDTDIYLERDSERIKLAGVMDPPAAVEEPNEEDIRHIQETIVSFSKYDPGMFTILACHRASFYPYIKDLPVDLILSGDLHGGIIRLPFLGGIIGKSEGILPEYDYGFYQEGDGAAMIVSGGCDYNEKKRRYFNPPEVVMVTLKKA